MFADLISIATRLIALVQAFDQVAADEESLDAAQNKFKDLLEVSKACVQFCAFHIQHCTLSCRKHRDARTAKAFCAAHNSWVLGSLL